MSSYLASYFTALFHALVFIQNNCICGLARVEHTDFLQPMFVGEIAHLHAVATYCSAHSIEVKVDVHAENLFKGIFSLVVSGKQEFI